MATPTGITINPTPAPSNSGLFTTNTNNTAPTPTSADFSLLTNPKSFPTLPKQPSGVNGIATTIPTVQIPSPISGGVPTTKQNPIFTPNAPITTPSAPFYSPLATNKGAITVNSAAQTNNSKATPTPSVPAANIGQTNTLTVPTSNSSSVSSTATNNLGTAVNASVNSIPVDANGNYIDKNNTQGNAVDQYGNPHGTTYNQDGSINTAGSTNVLGVSTGSQTRTGILGMMQGLLGLQATKPQVGEQAYQNAGIYDKMGAANDINNKILSTQRSYDEQAKTIKNNAGGLDVAGVNEQLATNSRQQNEDMANLSIIKSANDNDLQTAQNIIDKKLSLQFDPLQTEISNLGTFLQLNNADVTDSQKSAIAVKQYQLQNNLDLLKGAKSGAQQFALQQGIKDPAVFSAIDAATTPSQAYQALQMSGGMTSSTQAPNGGIVAGYNFGTGGPGSYATDPTKSMQVQNILNTVNGNNATASPASLSQYIQSIAPNSPITGQQILDAAKKYGIDPGVLTANVQQESQFGTAGVGAKTFNAGNIGNTDNGNTNTFSSWQDGLDANAKWLSKHRATDAQNASANIPSSISQFVIPEGVKGVFGTAYLDPDRLTGTDLQNTQAKQAATAAHIPVLTTQDVGKVRSIDVTKQNLQKMTGLVQNILGSGATGRIGSIVSNNLAAFTQSNPSVAAFNSYRTLAINALQALGAGSGGARITAGEIATATDNLPTINDSIQTANQKASILNGFLDNWTKEILPNAQVGDNGGSSSSGGSNYNGITLPN